MKRLFLGLITIIGLSVSAGNPPAVPNTEFTSKYEKIIRSWILSASDCVYVPRDRPDLAFYGTGTDTWGMQTHMKGFSAFAVAARFSRDPKEIELALKMLRFTLETYKGGSYHCMEGDNVQWGHQWLAALAIERMMHGIEAIDEWLTADDRARLRRLLISEADYICDKREVTASHIDPSKNFPESNLWSGALCHRVAAMYPDAARVKDYRRHGTALLLNSISIPSDATSEKIYDGKPMKEWFKGANYFEDYALIHHGYLNVGYMVICLSNISMLHFSFKRAGIKPPEALYHHFADLWKFVRTCIFDDGRLMRIGGDTRIRYCYCQDYLVPVFALVSDVLSEDMTGEEKGWLALVEKEMAYNGDNTFLSKRCELMVERSPLYFARLESDRACTLSMLWAWRTDFPEIFNATEKASKDQHWYTDYLGGYYHRTKKRIASFAWRSGSIGHGPQGNLLPPDESSMAEWRYNMVSSLKGGATYHGQEHISHTGRLIEGGFITGGKYVYLGVGFLEENVKSDYFAQNKIVFCALPDNCTVVTLQLCQPLHRAWLTKVKPFNLQMPNDLFNNEVRDYKFHNGSLTIDGKLTVTPIYGGELKLHKNTERTISLNDVYDARGMLRVDDILVGGTDKSAWYDKDKAIFDFAVAVRVDDKAAECKSFVEGDIRAISVRGDDGKNYIVAANFGEKKATFTAFGETLTLDAEGYEIIADCTK